MFSGILLHGQFEYWNTIRPYNFHSLTLFIAFVLAIYLFKTPLVEQLLMSDLTYFVMSLLMHTHSVQVCYTHWQHDLNCHQLLNINYIMSLPGFHQSFNKFVPKVQFLCSRYKTFCLPLQIFSWYQTFLPLFLGTYSIIYIRLWVEYLKLGIINCPQFPSFFFLYSATHTASN